MIDKPSDMLIASKINSIGYPVVEMWGGSKYDLEMVCVETGCARIYVCGIPQLAHWDDFKFIYDGDGNKYATEDFYNE